MGEELVCVLMDKATPKKHVVRYDSSEEGAAITTVYISKEDLPNPYPKRVFVKVEVADE